MVTKKSPPKGDFRRGTTLLYLGFSNKKSTGGRFYLSLIRTLSCDDIRCSLFTVLPPYPLLADQLVPFGAELIRLYETNKEYSI